VSDRSIARGRCQTIAAWCVLAAIMFSGCSSPAPSPPVDDERPDLVLVTMDTVRADHCSAYGYPRPTTPFLEELAKSGVLFRQARSSAPWTLPSVASIHTGLYPSEHGANAAEKGLSEDALTLAEVLRERGYQTVAVVSHSFTDSTHGLAQGFDRFDQSQIRGHDAVTSPTITDIALRMLRRVDHDHPVFLWVHYFDPHATYVDHRELDFAERGSTALPAMLTPTLLREELAEDVETGDSFPPDDLEYVMAVYDEEIRWTDASIRGLIEGIQKRRAGRRHIVAITSDHGEYFLERGRFFHGRDVYDQLMRVPLVIGGDISRSLRGHRVDAAVGTIDIARTLLAQAEIADADFPGHDMMTTENPAPPTPAIYLEGCYAWGSDERKLAVVEDGFKLIHRLDEDAFELYDLERDPSETKELSGEAAHQNRFEALRQRLQQFPPRHTRDGVEVEVDRAARERLRSLGYIN
jgi:arylsulfatase A-like enzyme